MIGPWNGIRPHPQHQITALSCGARACAPWPNQGCAARFLAEEVIVAETTLPVEQQVRLGVLCERLNRARLLVDETLDEFQKELDAFGTELGAPDIDDPRVDELLNNPKGDEGGR